MMTELRKRMSIFLWVVAAAFILFIFLQWGMNITGGGDKERRVDTIAKVNGTPIKTRTYVEKLSAILNNLRDSQNLTYIEPLTERLVEESAFEELIRETIIRDELKKYKITVTYAELIEILKNSPPKEVLEDSLMYTNGKFDPQKYISILLNPANRYFLYEHTNRIRESYPMTKLNSMLLSGIKVTQPEILKFYQEESLKVKVTFVPFRIEDYLDKVSLSENDLQDYYAIHKSEFEENEGVHLKAVTFEVKPTLTDQMEAKREIDDLYELYAGGLNFDTLAILYSQDGNSNQNGGDIGFVKKGDLEEDFERIVFMLKKNKVSEPFQTSFGWHIAKVTEIKGNERKISHILIKIVPGYETISQIKEKIDTFKRDAKDTGFEEITNTLKLDVSEIVLYKDNVDLVPEIGQIVGINSYLFGERRKEKDVAGPFIGYDGDYHIFLILKYIEPEINDFDEIKDLITEKARREKAIDLANEEARQCFEQMRMGKNLHQAALLFGKTPRTTQYFSMHDFIPEVPYSSEFYGLAFTMNKDEIGITKTRKGSFIIQLHERKEAEKEHFADVSNSIFANTLLKKRESIISYWFQNIRENANIKDNRHLIDIY